MRFLRSSGLSSRDGWTRSSSQADTEPMDSLAMLKLARRRISRLVRDERGMLTLTELLVAIPIMLAVFGATVYLYDMSVRSQQRTEKRAQNLVHQKNGLERISRELRTAIAVRYQTSEVVDAQLARTNRWVRYDCSGGQCSRYEGASQGAWESGPVPVIRGVQYADFQLLANAPGSGLQPNYVSPSYVVITLKVTAGEGRSPIVLNDGFNLRNLTEA
jgi:Tfp pilus assembly protein PilW